jgi:hypothetical protein
MILLNKFEMGWLCSMGKHEETKTFEDLGVDEYMILHCTLKKWDGVIGWSDLTQDRVGGGLL